MMFFMKSIKITALILLVCVFFASCSPSENPGENKGGQPQNETAENPAEATTIERPAIPEGTNYGGYAFRVLTPDVDFTTLVDEIYSAEETGDVMNDAVYKRNRLIENMLSINISAVSGPGHWLTELPPYAIKIIQAGEDAFDIIDGAYQPRLAFAGCLENLYNVPGMDLSKPWWDKRMIEDLSYGGNKLYYVIGDIGWCGMSGVMCTLFNKKMFEDFGVEYPYQKVRQGKWTLDEYAKLIRDAARDLDGDGVMDETDQWGLSGNSGTVLWSMLGCGEKVISLDQNGLPFINSLSERHVQVISALSGLTSDKNYVLLAENLKLADPYAALDAARNESRLLFFSSTVAGIPNMRALEFDFGVIPSPKFDENQPEYRSPATSYSSGASSISIPVTNGDLERTGTILEAMSGYSTDIIIPALIDVALKSKYTRDEESAEMIELILRTKMFDPLMEYGWGRLAWGGLYWDVYSNITIKGFDTFTSSVEKQLPKGESDTELFITTFDEMD
jgi:ABC-type glycerol-3-phosphate transport system substrate-binding protein